MFLSLYNTNIDDNYFLSWTSLCTKRTNNHGLIETKQVTSKESKLGCCIALCVLTKVYKHQSYISDICIVKLENLDFVKQNLKGFYRNDF